MFLADQAVVDEAEGVTAMVSDWLELDAADDWSGMILNRMSPLTQLLLCFFSRSAIILVLVLALALEKKMDTRCLYLIHLPLNIRRFSRNLPMHAT